MKSWWISIFLRTILFGRMKISEFISPTPLKFSALACALSHTCHRDWYTQMLRFIISYIFLFYQDIFKVKKQKSIGHSSWCVHGKQNIQNKVRRQKWNIYVYACLFQLYIYDAVGIKKFPTFFLIRIVTIFLLLYC